MKGNQPTLLAACAANFTRAQAADFVGADVTTHPSVEHAHGRTDERYKLALANPQGLPVEWVDAKAVLYVNHIRTVKEIPPRRGARLPVQQTPRGEDPREVDPQK